MTAIVKEDPPDLGDHTRRPVPGARSHRPPLSRKEPERALSDRARCRLRARSALGIRACPAHQRFVPGVTEQPTDRASRSRRRRRGGGGPRISRRPRIRPGTGSGFERLAARFAIRPQDLDPQSVFNARFMNDGKTIVSARRSRANRLSCSCCDPMRRFRNRKARAYTYCQSRQLASCWFDRRVCDPDGPRVWPRGTPCRISTALLGRGATTTCALQIGGRRIRSPSCGTSTGSITRVPQGTVLYTTRGYITTSACPLTATASRSSTISGTVRRPRYAQIGRSGEAGDDAGEQRRWQGFPGQTGLAWTPDGSVVLFTVGTASEEPPLRAVSVSTPGVHRIIIQTPGMLALHDVAPNGSSRGPRQPPKRHHGADTRSTDRTRLCTRATPGTGFCLRRMPATSSSRNGPPRSQ